MVLAPGDEFAGYTIEAVLGTGGMGAVYLAKHPRLPRRDALKLLSPTLSDDPSFRARFEREADLAAGLVHRNIVAVYDRGAAGPDDRQLWISMQYVAGTDAAVAARAGDGAMTPERVVNIISEVGAGLDHAHRAGLLHRDVKPANILLAASDDPNEAEHVLLTDFGIAKSTDEVQHLTGTGNLLATLAYASPEQIEARPLDRRVDIYALGCVLYELLTGSVPFPEATPFATMTAHLKQPPPRPSARVGWLPPGFDDVVAKAMAKNPDDRYASCREMALACRAALAAASTAPAGAYAAPTRAETSPLGTAAPRQPQPAAENGPMVAPAEAVGLTRPRPPFTVTIRRTFRQGGRVQEMGPVRSAVLPAVDRVELERLLEASNFFSLPPRLPLEVVVADDVLQEITVENAQLRRTVVFEREGSKHATELDALIRLMGRHAGWVELHPLATGAAYPGWSPTGTVPPLGGQAYQPTEAIGAAGGYGGAHPSGPLPSTPGSGWSGTGPHSFPNTGGGTHPSGPQALVGTGPHGGVPGNRPGIPVGRPPAGRSSRRWLWLATAAVVIVAAIGTTVFFATRTSEPVAPTAPGNLAATGAEDLTVALSWSAPAGATGYTVSRDGTQVYQGPATSFTDDGGYAQGGTGVEVGGHTYTVTASNVNGQRSPAATVAVTVPKGPWGSEAFLVKQFPDLLPTSPAGSGYNQSTCTVKSDSYGSGADAIIGCKDADGVYTEVMHFPDTQTWKAYLARDYATSTATDWDRQGVVEGQLYRSPDGAEGVPTIYTSFSAPERQNYLIYAEWQDHTGQELYDTWWLPAPF